MPWILVGLLLVVLSLALLGVLVLGLYRRVRVLARDVARTAEVVAQATEGLAVAPPAPRPAVAAPPAVPGRSPRGRR